MEINKIYNEDCLETLKRMEDNSIDLVVTSPPYNKGWYGDWKADKNSAWSVGGIKYDTYEDAMPPEEYEKLPDIKVYFEDEEAKWIYDNIIKNEDISLENMYHHNFC